MSKFTHCQSVAHVRMARSRDVSISIHVSIIVNFTVHVHDIVMYVFINN